MAIQRLNIKNFRNIQDVTLFPSPRINYLCGPNGSGKTSLLEAIHCLGRSRSFRTHSTNQLINKNSENFFLVAKVVSDNREFNIGFQHDKQHSEIHLAGKQISRAGELASALPIAVLETGLHTIIEGSPEYRRKFLDWGVFHVEHDFHLVWKRFRRALSQRNASIKAGWSRKAISQWNNELVDAAQKLDSFRRVYVQQLVENLEPLVSSFSGLGPITLNYQSGWRQGSSYGEYLNEQFDSDLERGFTQFGPHRADLRIQTHNGLAKDILSRGQQKLCMASLVLAQCQQLSKQMVKAVILVDDLAAELDQENRDALIHALINTGSQVFITCTDIFSTRGGEQVESKMFHVKQGNIVPT